MLIYTLISYYYGFSFLPDWGNFTISVLNANSLSWASMCPCWYFYLRDEQRTASFSLLMPFGYLSSEFPKLSLRFVPCLQGASTVLDLHPSFPPLLLAPYIPPGRCDEMFVPKPGTGTERHPAQEVGSQRCTDLLLKTIRSQQTLSFGKDSWAAGTAIS